MYRQIARTTSMTSGSTWGASRTNASPASGFMPGAAVRALRYNPDDPYFSSRIASIAASVSLKYGGAYDCSTPSSPTGFGTADGYGCSTAMRFFGFSNRKRRPGPISG